jgi:hypothetical protein
MLFSKKIRDCKVLDKYKIDIDNLISNNDKSIKLIAENDKYCFYDFDDPSNHYILRQNKQNRKEVVSFGWFRFYDMFCIWDKFLIMAQSGKTEKNVWDGFIFIDTETGERRDIGLRSEYGNMIFINGYGRYYNQDTIKKMYSKDDVLIIEFHREKYTQKDADKVPYNEDMDYTLEFMRAGDDFSAHRSFEDESPKPSKETKKSKEEKKLELKGKTNEFYKEMISFREENGLEDDLTDSNCEFYALVFSTIYEATSKQFTFDEIFNIYDFFTDVADGKKPNVDLFDKDDSFKGFYRLSKRYSLTKKLEEQERLLLCFCIYQAKYIYSLNEETQELEFNKKLFEGGLKAIKEEFEYEKEEFPGKFEIIVLSDPTKDDYGYSIENPIEVTAVAVEYQYLRGITYHGEEITFEHGPDSKGPHDNWVDSFDIFVGGEKVTTLHFTSDGSYNSITCPKGFEFIK